MNPDLYTTPEFPSLDSGIDDLLDNYKKVNRLIIVGNGFDLAHGLKSSFKDFIVDYCSQALRECFYGLPYQDELIHIKASQAVQKAIPKPTKENALRLFQEIVNRKHLINGLQLKWKSTFFKAVMSDLDEHKWVDIEVIYFKYLAREAPSFNRENVSLLNQQFEFLREHFLEYLQREIQGFEFNYCKELESQFTQDIRLHDSIPNTIAHDKPAKSICVLNFNYTDLALQYLQNSEAVSVTHIPIHGQLDGDNLKSQKPVFGFGDELDSKYAEFEHQDNDTVFEHIKSFKYLQFGQYRKLLEFIESDPYQVHIYGHSCGVSDRTLLNTIFENENCISVKPFYFQWEGGDDYEQKSFAIARHFKSKARLRSVVVNKQRCEPMAQPIIEK